MNEKLLVQNVIDKYFNDNPDSFVKHHLDSYNKFFDHDIKHSAWLSLKPSYRYDY